MVLVSGCMFCLFCGQQVACKAPSCSTLLDGMKTGRVSQVAHFCTNKTLSECTSTWRMFTLRSERSARIRTLTADSEQPLLMWWLRCLSYPICYYSNCSKFVFAFWFIFHIKKLKKTSFYCKWSINRCWPLTNEIMMMMIRRKQRNCVSMQANISVEESS